MPVALEAVLHLVVTLDVEVPAGDRATAEAAARAAVLRGRVREEVDRTLLAAARSLRDHVLRPGRATGLRAVSQVAAEPATVLCERLPAEWQELSRGQ